MEMGSIREDQLNQFTLDRMRQLILHAHDPKTSQICTYITAGAHQFRTIWVRDFCWGIELWSQLHLQSPAFVLPQDIYKALRATIRLCLSSPINDQGFAPRGYDVISPKITVCLGLLNLPKFKFLGQTLKPEFIGEHGTVAFDSNLLIALLAINLQKAQVGSVLFQIKQDLEWSNEELQSLCQKLLQAYNHHLTSEGLLRQPVFSDWQDSARRNTETSYINFLYLSVLQSMNSSQALTLTEKYFQIFFDASSKLFRSETSNSKRISIDSNLIAWRKNLFTDFIQTNDFAQAITDFYGQQHHPPVQLFYEDKDISWTTKICGLRHYHDQMIWPWQQHQLNLIRGQNGQKQVPLNTEASFSEILDATTLLPFKSFIYKSEIPFFWSISSFLGSKLKTK